MLNNTKAINNKVQIRWMILKDMPSVLGIENRCFEFPWSKDDFVKCLKQLNCVGMVAEIDGQVAGFMLYELHKNRLHLLTIAVDPAYRKRGVFTAMINKLKGKLSVKKRNRIMIEVRESNLAAQLAFKALGFRAISVLRNFYDDTDEDAYLFSYRYAPTAEEAAENDYDKPYTEGLEDHAGGEPR